MDVAKLSADLTALNKRLSANEYAFEFETEDIIFGFRKLNKKKTRNMVKALNIERKLRSDLGKFISPSVRIISLKMYRNGELRGEFYMDK